MAQNRKKTSNRKERGSFTMLHHAITNSKNYRSLSGNAVKLLIDTMARYNGKNNGDFDYSLKNMKKWGWCSNDTISRAKKELLEKGWIVLTRQGGLHLGASLYALTIWSIDECGGKLDRKETRVPLAYWKECFNIENKKVK